MCRDVLENPAVIFSSVEMDSMGRFVVKRGHVTGSFEVTKEDGEGRFEAKRGLGLGIGHTRHGTDRFVATRGSGGPHAPAGQ